MKLFWAKLTRITKHAVHIGLILFLVFSVLSASMGVVMIMGTTPGWAAGHKVVHLQLFGGIVHIHDGNHDNHLETHSEHLEHSELEKDVRYSNPAPGVVERVSSPKLNFVSLETALASGLDQDTATASTGTNSWLQIFSSKATDNLAQAKFAKLGQFERLLPNKTLLPSQPYLELPPQPPQI